MIEAGSAAQKILNHLGLRETRPALVPARIDPAGFQATGLPPPDCEPPWTDDVQRSPADFPA